MGWGLGFAASASGFTLFALGYGVLFGPGAGVPGARQRSACRDRTGSYASTVWVAAGINVLGMLVAGRLPAR